jgi:hypothetical protein
VENWDLVDGLRETLEATIRVGEQVREGHSLRPADGSPALAELAVEGSLGDQGAWGKNPVRQAHDVALMLLLFAENGAKGLDLLLDRRPPFRQAMLAASRSSIECAGRAWWLADPNIDVRTRVARVMNERMYSLEELGNLPAEFQRLAVQEPFWSTDGSADPEVRRAEILASGKKLHYVPKKRWIHEERPGSRRVVRGMLSRFDPSLGDLVYGYYSSAVHGTIFGMISGLVAETEVDDSYRGLGSISGSSETAYGALLAMAVSYLEAGSRVNALNGWDDFGWPGWVQQAESDLHAIIIEHQERLSVEAGGNALREG